MMEYDTAQLTAIVPEMFVLGMACLILVLDLFLKDSQRIVSYSLTQITLVLAIVLTLADFPGEPLIAFDNSFIRDALGDVLKISIYVMSGMAFLYAKDYLRDRNLFKGEYYVLGLFAVLGMMVMVSANSFLTIYLGLELLSLSLYAMVAFDRDSGVASEAAMKYFVLGALASGMLLYGISMIYGATGALDFPTVADAIATQGMENKVLVFGLVFVVVGLGFKMGAVPFHMWIPDVYHGAPTCVTLFIGSTPKIAAFALAMRLLVDGLETLQADWQGMLVILSILSMGLGNIVAIAQDNLKRMLAYSTISHVGFILLGILAGTPDGYTAAMFYTLVYALMALGGFGIIILLSREGFESDELHDMKGLGQRSPWFAAMMLLLMFSMAGVPPTAGFFAKLLVLQAVVEVDMTWLAVVGVVFSIIGAFYYLRVIKLMYFDKPIHTEPLRAGLDAQVTMSVNGLAMLWFGLFPASLMSVCHMALG
jgi:NADH-quinone oxidoreductase subunit N